jgi:hypothetical protein
LLTRSVAVFDLSSGGVMKVLGPDALGLNRDQYPCAMALSPDEEHLAVATVGTVSLLTCTPPGSLLEVLSVSVIDIGGVRPSDVTFQRSACGSGLPPVLLIATFKSGGGVIEYLLPSRKWRFIIQHQWPGSDLAIRTTDKCILVACAGKLFVYGRRHSSGDLQGSLEVLHIIHLGDLQPVVQGIELCTSGGMNVAVTDSLRSRIRFLSPPNVLIAPVLPAGQCTVS